MFALVLGACGVAPPPCGVGMVPIPAAPGTAHTCIDAYEVTVIGTPGARDDPQARTAAVARSLPGVLPSVGVSFDQALSICAMSPVVHPTTGATVGVKHLATASEWQDAGDGVAGPGGHRYPWGDDPAPGRCALAPLQGPLVQKELAATGAFPACVGPTGAYDLLGNAWEWVDSGIRMDLGAWAAAATGLVVEGDDLRVSNPTHLRSYAITVPNLPGHLDTAADGGLVFVADRGEATETRGYLIHDPGRTLPERQAPVELTPIPDLPGRFRVRLVRAWDGATFPDKRGGAWYAGGTFDLATTSYQHVPNFIGTIGFRCAGPAL